MNATKQFPTVRWRNQLVTFLPGSTRRQPAPAALLFAFFSGRAVLVDIEGRGWSIPGGHVQEGESPRSAVLREATEEAGITMQRVMPLGSYRLEKDTGVISWVPVFLGEVSYFRPIPDDQESHACLLVEPHDLQHLYYMWDPLLEAVWNYALDAYATHCTVGFRMADMLDVFRKTQPPTAED